MSSKDKIKFKKNRNGIPVEYIDKAKKEIKKYGYEKALHYAVYNANWTTGPSKEEKLYLRAINELGRVGANI